MLVRQFFLIYLVIMAACLSQADKGSINPSKSSENSAGSKKIYHLTGRNAAVFAQWLLLNKAGTEVKYGAQPAPASVVFPAIFDVANCTKESTFRAADVRIDAKRIYCYFSDRAVWDLLCEIDMPKGDKKVTTGIDAYLLQSFLLQAQLPVKKVGTSGGSSISAFKSECVFNGNQSCLGTEAKNGVCNMWQ